MYNLSSLPGFGGHAGITAFFVDRLTITYNHIQTTAYNGINLGWGWQQLHRFDDVQEQYGQQQPPDQYPEPTP